MNSIAVKGTIVVGGGSCVSEGCGSGGDQSVKALSLRCAAGQQFQSAVETASTISLSTPGIVGAVFADADLLSVLTSIELLYVKADRPILVRIGADAARVLGVGGTFPTLFVGAETLLVTVDAVPVTVTFLVTDQTAAQCVARINAACALAGLSTPRASVATSGQIQIEGSLTGYQGTVTVTGGTGAVVLGLSGLSGVGAGADVPLWGTLLQEFGAAGQMQPPLPQRIQFSGLASLNIVAAGSTT